MPRRKKRGDILADALPAWEGTPFHPHARIRGAGCDCKGMLWGACAELGFPEADSEHATALDYDLAKPLPADRLKAGFAALFGPARDIRRGDILLCKWDGRAGHIAVADGSGRAWSALPRSGVRRRKLETLFHAFPLDSIWRLRER